MKCPIAKSCSAMVAITRLQPDPRPPADGGSKSVTVWAERFNVMPPKVSSKRISGSLKLFIVLCIFWFLKFSGLLNSLLQKF